MFIRVTFAAVNELEKREENTQKLVRNSNSY